jgi:hypothetical protein
MLLAATVLMEGGATSNNSNNNNSYRFRVPHQVCLPGSRSKTVRAMRCETCMLLLENHSMPPHK